MGRLTTLMGAALCLGVLAIVPAFAEGDYIVVLEDGMSPTRGRGGMAPCRRTSTSTPFAVTPRR